MFDLTTQQSGGLIAADPAAVAAAEAAKARIQSAYVMAFQKPRNEDQARVRILKACRRPQFAERVEYSKPVGDRRIKGPSIRFAELALREWANVLTESTTVYEDDSIRRVRITCIDLETNATFSKEVNIRKTVERRFAKGREVVAERTNSRGDTVYVVKATDDELVNKEASFVSKAIRNEGLRLIPSDIIDEGLQVARETLQHRDAQDPDAAKKRLLDAFAGLGIQPKHLEQYLGHSLDTLGPAELGDLRDVYRAIKDGEASWAEYMHAKHREEADNAHPDGEAEDDWRTALSALAAQLPIDRESMSVPEIKSLNDDLEAFVSVTAEVNNVSRAEVVKQALNQVNGFWATVIAWREKQGAQAAGEPQEAQGPPEAMPEPQPEAEAKAQEAPPAESGPTLDELLTEISGLLERTGAYKDNLPAVMEAIAAHLTNDEIKKLRTDLVRKPVVLTLAEKAINAAKKAFQK